MLSADGTGATQSVLLTATACPRVASFQTDCHITTATVCRSVGMDRPNVDGAATQVNHLAGEVLCDLKDLLMVVGRWAIFSRVARTLAREPFPCHLPRACWTKSIRHPIPTLQRNLSSHVAGLPRAVVRYNECYAAQRLSRGTWQPHLRV